MDFRRYLIKQALQNPAPVQGAGNATQKPMVGLREQIAKAEQASRLFRALRLNKIRLADKLGG